MGYVEGLDLVDEAVLQQGFNDGFRDSAMTGFADGAHKGALA